MTYATALSASLRTVVVRNAAPRPPGKGGKNKKRSKAQTADDSIAAPTPITPPTPQTQEPSWGPLDPLRSLLPGALVSILDLLLTTQNLIILLASLLIYTWFFRGIPRLVLVVLFGTGIGYLYPRFDIGPFPFSQQLAGWLGMSNDLTLFSLNVNEISTTLIWAILAMGLSEAAYMAEIARAGIMSVDDGQREAAAALGMGPSLSMRRVVLPQAMRVIIPPTGNETIAIEPRSAARKIVDAGDEDRARLRVVEQGLGQRRADEAAEEQHQREQEGSGGRVR